MISPDQLNKMEMIYMIILKNHVNPVN